MPRYAPAPAKYPPLDEKKIDVKRLPQSPFELFGRQTELDLLDQAWESPNANVLCFVAYGGVGKTTLINKWLEKMRWDNYRGTRRVFAWSFYSQGTGDRVTSADIFINEALKWFGDSDMAKSNASAWDKGQRLAELVRQEKTLLLLDGMEPLQSYLAIERGKIKDPALGVLVTELARENPGLCVITTRENVADLSDFATTAQQTDLEQISAEAGRALLRVGGVQGTDAELEQTARDFGLHALALNLLAAYLHDIPGHHISHAAEIPDLDAPLEKGKHPRRVMAAFANRFGASAEVDVLQILGMFSSPANKEEIAAVRAAPPIPGLTEHLENISDAAWLQVVNHLRRMKLILPESSHRPDTLDAHPLVREHFGEQLKEANPAAWREGNNRLYEYYKVVAKELPDTLQEMAPLFAAVIHGCQAGRHQEAYDDVYRKRIRRGNEQYQVKKLGAFGSDLAAISGFFDGASWRKSADGLREDTKGWLLNQAGFCLRALGRLAEAAQPMQASLEAAIAQKDWKNAAIRASNLSELTLTLGDVTQALAYAEQSVGLADQSRNEFQRLVNRTQLGDKLHLAGRLAESQATFCEAEEIQKKRQPDFPLLYSLQGFHYCDLLLSQGDYAEVERRASQTLEWRNTERTGFLTLRLTISPSGVRNCFTPNTNANCSFAKSLPLPQPCSGWLTAGRDTTHCHVACSRARSIIALRVSWIKSQKDLDEAFSISTRGGMGLFLADCHLEYARLSLARGTNERRGEALLTPTRTMPASICPPQKK